MDDDEVDEEFGLRPGWPLALALAQLLLKLGGDLKPGGVSERFWGDGDVMGIFTEAS